MIVELILLLTHDAKKNKHRATATFGDWKNYGCTHCGCRYRHWIERTIVGKGPTLEAAQDAAERLSRSTVKNAIVPRPCPTCGLFQANLIVSRRFRFHSFVFLGLLFALAIATGALILTPLMAGEAAIVTLVGSWIPTVVIGLGFLAHLLVDWYNPNRTVRAGREEQPCDTIEVLQPGDDLTSELLAGAAWRPRGQMALYGVMLAAFLLTPTAEAMRLVAGWPMNPDCTPIVSGPGDQPAIYFPNRIRCVKGYWHGGGRAEIVNAAELGVPPTLTMTTNRDNWGDSIHVKAEDRNTTRQLWVKVNLPNNPKLAGQNVRIKMDLEVFYPQPVGNQFENQQETFTHTATLKLAADHEAGWTYQLLYWLGGIGGLALALLMTIVLTVRTKFLLAKVSKV